MARPEEQLQEVSERPEGARGGQARKPSHIKI